MNPRPATGTHHRRFDKDGLWRYITDLFRQSARSRWAVAVVPLCDGLARFLGAGLSLPVAMECLASGGLSRDGQRALRAAAAGIQQGKPLSAVWANDGSPLFLAMLEASELSGRLPEMLRAWVVHVERRRRRARELGKLFGYPAFVAVSNLGLLIYVGNHVLPSFHNLYAALGHDTNSSLATVVMAIANRLPWLLAIAAVAMACVFRLALMFQMATVPRRGLTWIRRLPGLKLVAMARTSTYCLLLSTLLDAGLPLLDSLRSLAGQVGPDWLRLAAAEAHRRLLQGAPIHEALDHVQWDPTFTLMVRWAEQTGTLVDVLKDVQALTEEALMTRVKVLMGVAEPVILALLGAVVLGTMAVIFVPLYTELTSIEGQGLQ